LSRHMHPRPPAAKRARVSFHPALPVPSEVLLGQEVSATERPGAGWGGGGGGEQRTARIGTGSGKGKEPMNVDDADTWMGHADMMTPESGLDNTHPFQRRHPPFMQTEQMRPLQATDADDDADAEATMGLETFANLAMEAERPVLNNTNSGLTLDRANNDLEHTRAPETALGPRSIRPPRRKSLWAKTGHSHDHRRDHKGQGWD